MGKREQGQGEEEEEGATTGRCMRYANQQDNRAASEIRIQSKGHRRSFILTKTSVKNSRHGQEQGHDRSTMDVRVQDNDEDEMS